MFCKSASIKIDKIIKNRGGQISDYPKTDRKMETENAKILDFEALKSLKPGEVFAKGEVLNDPEGVFMTDHRRGDTLKWVAQRGDIHDWAIYLDWAEKSYEQVLRNGQKTYNTANIQKLVPCTEAVLSNYRF